jgi:tetratricopeptide (TPR) repeat protein
VRGRLLALVLAAAASLSSALAQANLYRASSLYRLQKYEKLLELLEGMDDGPPRLYLYRAESLAHLERRGEAVKAYQALIEKYPDHPDAFDARRKVMLLLDQDKNYPALIDMIRKFRDEDSGKRLPYDRLEADAHFKAGHYDEAIGLLERADDEADLRTLAEILIELGRGDAYLVGRPVPPGDFAAARRRGLLLEHLRRMDAARQWYRKALDLKPEDTLSLERLAAAAEVAGDRAEAMDAYERLVALDPAELKYGAQLGKLLWAEGRQDDARKAWAAILEAGEDDPQRIKLVVRLHLDHQDPAPALERIRAGRTLLQDPRLFREEEESAHRMNRDMVSAVEVWLPLLVRPTSPGSGEIDPRERILEIAGDGGGNMDAAWTAVKRAVERYPGLVEYTLLADELLRLSGRDEEIEALIDGLAASAGGDPGLLHDHALRFRDEALHQESAQLFLAAREAAESEERWLLSLEAARELRIIQRPDRARELLATFLTEDAEAPVGLVLQAADLEGRILLEDLAKNVEARAHFTRWIPRLGAESPFVVPWVVLAARGAAGAGDFPAAETAYEALLERGGNKRHTAEVHFRLGRLHLYAGELEEARKILRSVGEDYPDSDFANDAVGEVAFLLDHRDAGEEALKSFLGLRHLVDAGRLDEFRKAAREASLEDVPAPLQDDHVMLQARVLRSQGAPKAEAALLRKGADLDEDGALVPRFLWLLAEAHERSGEHALAEAAWKEYLLRHADSLHLDAVRVRIRKLQRRQEKASGDG